MSNNIQKNNIVKSNPFRKHDFNFTIDDIARSILHLFGDPILNNNTDYNFIKKCKNKNIMSLNTLYKLINLYNGRLIFYFDFSKKNLLIIDDVDRFFSLAEKYCYNKRLEEEKNLSDKEYIEKMNKKFSKDISEEPLVRLCSFLAYKFPSSFFKISFDNKGDIEWSTNNRRCNAFVENNNTIISYDIKSNNGNDSKEIPTLINKIAETTLRKSDKEFIKKEEYENNRQINPYTVKDGATFIKNKEDISSISKPLDYNKNIKKLIKNGFIDNDLKLTKDTIEKIKNNEYQINIMIL